MSDNIRPNIESRRNAIFDNYEIEDEKLLKQINDYFERLEEFASKYDDPMKFETDFASSKYAKEYSDIFTKIMGGGITARSVAKDAGESLASEIVEDASLHARRKARGQVESQIRDIPIIGDVLNVKQHIDFFGRFKKNRKEDKNEEDV